MKMFKKGGMPWRLITWIIAIAIFLFILIMVYMARKGISVNITEIFNKW